MSLTDQFLQKLLIRSGLRREAAAELVARTSGSGSSDPITGFTSGDMDAAYLGTSWSTVELIGAEPPPSDYYRGRPGVSFAGDVMTFDEAGIYSVTFEPTFKAWNGVTATQVVFGVDHFTIAGEADSFWNSSRQAWPMASVGGGEFGPLMTLPPMRVNAGDSIVWGGYADVAEAARVRVYIIRIAGDIPNQ